MLDRLLLWTIFSLVSLQTFAGFSADTSPPVNPGTYKPMVPTPSDGRVAFITAKMLEQFHYSKQPFDDTVSTRLLERYLEMLDPQRMHFFQSDINEFNSYRTNLDNLTTPRSQLADVTPASHVFDRFLKRLDQRVSYAQDLLKKEDFKFERDDRATLNRKELPYPKDLQEARKLWRERLRFEYLQEKLAKIEARKKAEEQKEKGSKPEKRSAANKTDAEQIVDTLSHRYARNLRTFRDWDHDDLLQVYLTAMAHAYDPHSDYMGASQLESFAIGMNLSLFGIGAELVSEDGYCTIRRLLPGGPAVKSKKIKEKDRIVAVAQSNQPPVDVVDMNLNKAVQLIRGPKGTEVRLTLLPAESEERQVITLVRDEINLEDQAAKAKVIDVPGQNQNMRIGVIDLPSFYASFPIDTKTQGKGENRSTSADVARLLAKLKKENVQGLILDLRRNGGGSLEEAIRLTGLFIREGPIVQIKDTDGTVQVDSDTDPAILYSGPLIVLTSRFSASASEILAAALQDYGRALVVGDAPTHGKGTVQSVNSLKPWMRVGSTVFTNEPGALKLTIKKFYRASGASTQLKGVVPDIVLPSVFAESKDFGEGSLDNPLPWDVIQSSKYERFNMTEAYLQELKRRSGERVAADRDFGYIREDIELFRKLQADKTVSLNEKTRLKEKAENDARQKAREKEVSARKESREKVYEVTLKNVDLPGLPPPVDKPHGTNRASFGVGSTNASASLSSDAEEQIDEEKPPAVDAILKETQNILVDYLTLLPRGNVLTAGQ